MPRQSLFDTHRIRQHAHVKIFLDRSRCIQDILCRCSRNATTTPFGISAVEETLTAEVVIPVDLESLLCIPEANAIISTRLNNDIFRLHVDAGLPLAGFLVFNPKSIRPGNCLDRNVGEPLPRHHSHHHHYAVYKPL